MARARKKAKTRKLPIVDWRRTARWSLAAGLFALMAGIAGWGVSRLSDPTVLPLKVVRIDGRLKHLDRRDIENAVGAVMRGNFFTLDVRAVRAAAGRLPWVERVSVRRVWPDTLRMHVTEQVAFARWGKQRLVNPVGQVFAPAAEQIPTGLPLLQGPDGSGPRVVARFREVRQKFAALGLEVTSMSQDPRGAWRMVLQQDLELALGSADTDQRLHRFLQVYPQLSGQQGRRLKRVDLRYTNGFAVHWERVEAGTKEGDPPGAGSGGTKAGARRGKGRV